MGMFINEHHEFGKLAWTDGRDYHSAWWCRLRLRPFKVYRTLLPNACNEMFGEDKNKWICRYYRPKFKIGQTPELYAAHSMYFPDRETLYQFVTYCKLRYLNDEQFNQTAF